MKHRMCRVLLCLVLTFALLLPMTVGALADTTIGTDASRPEYFEALGGSGSYNPLKTPYHYDKTTGNVAYCLEHKKDSPSSSAAYTDFDPSALWGHNTVTGIQAIVDHGSPNSCGGLSEEQAHYATANAIRAWMKESADVGYNFMRVDEGHIRPLSGTAAQETWVFFLELLGYARAGATLGGTSGGMVRVYPANPVWEVQGNQLVTRIEVSSSDGYTIRRSSAEVDIAGYTGGTEDTLTLTAPLSLLTQDVQLLFTANAGAGVTLYWYEPVSASSQSVAVAELGGGSGILSVAALLLGADRALGVDIDPNAVDIAYNNADENGIARDRYTVVAGNVLDDNGFVDSLGTGYDIVVANIVAGVIVPLTDIVPRLLKKGGLYITSGIIAERTQEVIDAMQRNGFTVTYTENRKDWMVIVATR